MILILAFVVIILYIEFLYDKKSDLIRLREAIKEADNEELELIYTIVDDEIQLRHDKRWANIND
jgi:hypothetical protein